MLIKRVYVAGLLTPRGIWSSNHAIDYIMNVRNMIRVGIEVFKAGFVPFIPALDFLVFLLLRDKERITEFMIKRYSKDWLEVCEAVLLTKGWQKSTGTLAEIKRAEELNIPVFKSIKELKGKKMKQFGFKDSGKREAFQSGMVRDTREGKGRFDLISPFALYRIATIYEKGALKYKPRNWEKGAPFSRFLDSARRHINQFAMGLEDEDHLSHSIWNLMAIIHFEEMIKLGLLPSELNDLPKYMEKKNTKEKHRGTQRIQP